MDEIILGLSLAAIIVLLYNLIFGWLMYNKSIHKVIYSGFLEYYFKKNKIRKLSESTVFSEDFGKHRILFQLFSVKGQRSPQPYIIIILSSGMYFIKVSNAQGQITGKKTGAWEHLMAYDKKNPEKKVKEKFANPITELEQFADKVQEKISKVDAQVYKIAVFPDCSILNIKNEDLDGIFVIKRSQLMDTLSEIHKSKENLLNEWEIDALWDMTARDSLKTEER